MIRSPPVDGYGKNDISETVLGKFSWGWEERILCREMKLAGRFSTMFGGRASLKKIYSSKVSVRRTN